MTVDQSQFGGRARIPQLDLLRGIAVLMVMLFHYPLFNVFRIGWAGVDLLTSLRLQRERTEPETSANYHGSTPSVRT